MSINNIKAGGNERAVAVARRRILLKGVGKGAAILAATVPIQTLATQKVLTADGQHQCTMSGGMSGVHSATPTNTPRCSGRSAAYWGAVKLGSDPLEPLNTWPPGLSKEKFNKVFSSGQLQTNPTLFEVMHLQQFAGSVGGERHWVAAFLNASGGGILFPYQPIEVIGFYNQGPGSAIYQNALKFFTNFMETL